MKLISCYIENYGKIKAQTFDFNENLTVFCCENGYGKTTLASFVKAMFYGLKAYKKGTIDFCDRQHFYPFAGGEFGGNLTFEEKGKIYKIERFFGEKSNINDSLKVYLNGSLTDELGDEPGKKLFGIDEDSFQKTVFISEKTFDLSSTDSINAKFNNFLNGDDSNFSLAVKKLEEESKKYKKQRNGEDLIGQVSVQINDLDEKIHNLEKISSMLPQKYLDNKNISKEIEELNEKINKARKDNEIFLAWESYDNLIADIKTDEDKISHIKEDYPLGIPQLEERKAVRGFLDKDTRFKNQLEAERFGEEGGQKLKNFESYFSVGIPEDKKLQEINSAIQRVDILSGQIELAQKNEETEKERELSDKFSLGVPSEEEILKFRKKADEYSSVEKQYNETPAYYSENVYETPVKASKSSKKYTVLAILAAVGLVGGIGLFFLQRIFGLILMGASAILLIADGFLYLNKKTSEKNLPQTKLVQKENPERYHLACIKNGLEADISALIHQYGYSSNQGILTDFALFLRGLEDYKSFIKDNQQKKDKILQLAQEREELTYALGEFFGKYHLTGGNFSNLLQRLTSGIDTYQMLKTQKVQALKEEEKIKAQLQQNAIEIELFCKKYKFCADTLKDDFDPMEQDYRTLSDTFERITQNKKKAEDYRKQKNLTSRPLENYIDINELSHQLVFLQSEKARQDNEIRNDESQVDDLEDLKSQKEVAEDKRSFYQRKFEMLTATLSFLEEAEQSLKDKYVKPVKDKFVFYSDLIEKTLGEKISMDKNFHISFERAGKERSDLHLSAGQKSICALCFRLALTQNMYVEEKPFLIMDDPFVNLDETHLEKVKDLIKDLSQKFQIIYFACHESRNME